MVKPTPSRFNPDIMACDGTRYQVALPLKQFNRLQELLYNIAGDMQATFGFSRRKDHTVISGQLGASFTMQCQRCLEAMQVIVDEPFELVFVEDELAAQRLPDELDPVVLDEHGKIHVVDLFEDELILHLPDVPKHRATENCRTGNKLEFGTVGETTEASEKAKPFDVLKNLDLH